MKSSTKPPVMTDDIRVRIHLRDKDALREAAAAAGVPMAEHVRALLRSGMHSKPILTQVNEAIRDGRIAVQHAALPRAIK